MNERQLGLGQTYESPALDARLRHDQRRPYRMSGEVGDDDVYMPAKIVVEIVPAHISGREPEAGNRCAIDLFHLLGIFFREFVDTREFPQFFAGFRNALRISESAFCPRTEMWQPAQGECCKSRPDAGTSSRLTTVDGAYHHDRHESRY